MAENKHYVAYGEEPARGTPAVSTVGFIPLINPAIPTLEFDDQQRKEFRGEDTSLGPKSFIRRSKKWNVAPVHAFFTEAGTTKGMVGTIMKHFGGKATSVENGSTSQYAHMMYSVVNPFAAANLDNDALTFNCNLNEGASMKNWPHVGGRVKKMTFLDEPSQPLKWTVDQFGQFRDTVTPELGSVVMPAENLRCDSNNLSAYFDTITRVGTPPDYTDFTFGSATAMTPDKTLITLENGFEDFIVEGGVIYPTLTRLTGDVKATLELTFDWQDPTSGFSAVDDYNSWAAGISEQSFHFLWDTGTQAGTGDNHGLHIDLPSMVRQGGPPEYSEADPMITLKYVGKVNATTLYQWGILLKNSATAV